jgi:transposase
MANRVKVEIKETVDELKELIEQAADIRVKERLQVLYLLKSGQVRTLKAASQILIKDTATLYRWLRQYKTGGLAQMLDLYEARGKPASIPAEIVEKLKERLRDPLGFNSYKEIQEWLKSEQQLEVGYFVVYRLVRQVLKAKLKVPRPTSAKENEAAAQQFKRDLAHKINLAKTLWSWKSGEFKPPRKVRFWCEDEARVGLKTVVGRVITLKGVKPIGRVKWVRQAFYLYGLFEPDTGENFYYEFSHVATDCFQVFLDGFSQTYPEDLHVIQLDRGSFHSGQDLIIPDNVVLLFQPAHSPELNPAERVWEYIKSQLCWFQADTLDELRKKLDEIYAKLTNEVIASLTGWCRILNALNLARS